MSKRQKNQRGLLAGLVATLMLLAFLTGVLASELLLRVRDDTPRTEVDIDLRRDAAKAPRFVGAIGAIGGGRLLSAAEPSNPGAEFEDEEGNWNTISTIELFRAEYENESGEITVKSADGDKVIAPGTTNSYYFDIKNVGDTGIAYVADMEVNVSFTVDGVSQSIPLEVRMYDLYGSYVIGSSEEFAPIAALDGKVEKGGLGTGNYMRYTLEWRWPFEGNDELDTLLGNLAANTEVDAEIAVEIVINLTASEDPSQTGGAPQTGDDSKIPLLVAGCVGAMVLMVILLFMRRREREEEV